MHVIDRRLSKETTQDSPTCKRRSFFLRLLSSIAGGWITGNLFSNLVRLTVHAKSNEEVKVTINPLAVPRMKKDMISLGA